MKLGMISLGCAKNQIDTELFLGLCNKYNISITSDINEANILVVNTCGFIASAKKEAIDTILEILDYKQKGKIIIAMGCLVERYYNELLAEFPDIDYLIPIKNYNSIDKVFMEITGINEHYYFDYSNRVLTTLPHSAYLRIGEGCNNNCNYCAIPLIRGRYVSRSFESLIEEAKMLASNGVKELTVIAQDTTRYGTDFNNDNRRLQHLLHELSKINELKWIRVLYLYPDEVTDELLEEIKNNEKILPYFDLPLQHSSNEVLKNMNRRGNKEYLISLISKIKNIPNSVLRTTFIVGYPKETDDDFNDLMTFIKNIEFDRVGVFKYSDEEDTIGYTMKPKVPKKISDKRYKELMKAQNIISLEKNKKLIGKTFDVIVDEYSFDKNAYICRSYAYAPDDVDGCIYINANVPLIVGEFYKATIIRADSYDLYAIIK